MSKEINEEALKPLVRKISNLYDKYILLCSIDFSISDELSGFKKSLNLSAVELFKLLDDDFDKIFYEISKLEGHLSDEE